MQLRKLVLVDNEKSFYTKVRDRYELGKCVLKTQDWIIERDMHMFLFTKNDCVTIQGLLDCSV